MGGLILHSSQSVAYIYHRSLILSGLENKWPQTGHYDCKRLLFGQFVTLRRWDCSRVESTLLTSTRPTGYVDLRRLCFKQWCTWVHHLSENFHSLEWKFLGLLTTPTATIPNIFHGLVFVSTQWMFPQNLKSVALPVPEIIGGTQKIWAVTGYAHASFSPKLLMGFYLDWPCKCTRQIWSP